MSGRLDRIWLERVGRGAWGGVVESGRIAVGDPVRWVENTDEGGTR